MEKIHNIPEPVIEAASDLISSYGDGLRWSGMTRDGYQVYSYEPSGEPLIGTICFLYKDGEPVRESHGRVARSIEII